MAVEVADNRATLCVHFQELANVRLQEAKILLDAARPEGAYYLAGYAVECGLKACICHRRMKGGVFPDREFSREVYTHSLEKLMVLADLKAERQHWVGLHPKLGLRWGVVSLWSEETRYRRSVDLLDAVQIYEAVGAQRLGVLTWLKRYW